MPYLCMTPGAPEDRNDPQAGPDAEATAAAIAIAGLRRRLSRLRTLEHPAVRRELRRLDAQLAAQLDRAAGQPGRHRVPAGRTPGRPQPCHGDDPHQVSLRPDPAAARTAAQLTTMLGQYQAWSAEPSWATIGARSGHTVGHATIHAALHGAALPSLSLVTAVITECGGSQHDLTAFTTAWQRINAASTARQPEPPGPQPAPAAALRLLPNT